MRRWEVLEGWVKENGWTAGAELGVLNGATYLHLLKNCLDLTLIGVDIWTPRPNKEAFHDIGGRSYEDHDLSGYELNVRGEAARYGGRAILYKMTTVEAADLVEARSLDFVFIDADHMEAAVREDIAAWRPKVRAGGVLCGHDLHFPSVRRVIDIECPGWAGNDDYVWSVPC